MSDYLGEWARKYSEKINWIIGTWYGFSYCLIIPTLLVTSSVALGQLISFIYGEPLYRVPTSMAAIVYIPLLMAISMVVGIIAMALLFSVVKFRESVKRFIKRQSPPFIVEEGYGIYIHSNWVREKAWRKLKIYTLVGAISSAGVVLLLVIVEEIWGFRIPTMEVSGYAELPVLLFPVMGLFTAALPESGMLNDTALLIIVGGPALFFALAARNFMYIKKVSFLETISELRRDRDKRNIVVILYLVLSIHAVMVIWAAYSMILSY